MNRRDDMNDHANQMNPNNDAYWTTRGYDERPHDWEVHRLRCLGYYRVVVLLYVCVI